jgi:very-short-patch-repair endonuclease
MSNNFNQAKRKQQLYFKKAADKMFAGADERLFKRAAELRSQSIHAEELLWGYLRTKPQGFKFRRQHPYLNYILDFYCHALHLAIEVDGSIHNREDVKQQDEIRQKHLEEHSLTVLRFTNDEIEIKPESVISTVEQHLTLNASPHSKKHHKPKSPL